MSVRVEVTTKSFVVPPVYRASSWWSGARRVEGDGDVWLVVERRAYQHTGLVSNNGIISPNSRCNFLVRFRDIKKAGKYYVQATEYRYEDGVCQQVSMPHSC